jgi:predicted dehydrogenase
MMSDRQRGKTSLCYAIQVIFHSVLVAGACARPAHPTLVLESKLLSRSKRERKLIAPPSVVVVLICVARLFALGAHVSTSARVAPVRLAIAGLVHVHVDAFLGAAQKRDDVQIAGIFEPDSALRQRYAQRYGVPNALLFADLSEMLDQARPDAVAVFTSTYDHLKVITAAAERHVPVMVEKPLAVSLDHAYAIQRAASRGHIPVIVNYETSWYPSHSELWRVVDDRREVGEIRKMVAMDGHEGPKELDIPSESLAWVVDPTKNGAGALFDFGCYGANLMTWLMHNRRPITVTAVTHQNKPDIYERVDDEATIVLQYPKAQGIIQASWNWPFNRKDFEVYGVNGFAIATGGRTLRVRLGDDVEHVSQPQTMPPDERDPLSYLLAVVREQRVPTGLSSLENNMIVMEILQAAKDSARTGKTITLSSVAQDKQ